MAGISAGISLDNAFLLLVAIAGFWFVARFVAGPRRGAPGLRGMFTRESPVKREGMDSAAIATLLGDARKFVAGEAALHGLILAGPFAAGTALPDSTVTLVAFGESVAAYAGPEWLARWAYPAREHAVRQHDIAATGAGFLHRLELRGAPPLVFAFLPPDAALPEAPLREALETGMRIVEDPAGRVGQVVERWRVALRPPEARSGTA